MNSVPNVGSAGSRHANPCPASPITESDFCTWLSSAVSGDGLTYHSGFLARDVNNTVSALRDADRMELTHLARSARWAAEEGLVHLLQRRQGPEQFAYLAIARPRSTPRAATPTNRKTSVKETV